jgi:hypothetical protein
MLRSIILKNKNLLTDYQPVYFSVFNFNTISKHDDMKKKCNFDFKLNKCDNEKCDLKTPCIDNELSKDNQLNSSEENPYNTRED